MVSFDHQCDRLIFSDWFFTAEWDAATGALAKLSRSESGELLFEAADASLHLVVGGDPAENRVPEPMLAPGEPLLQSGSLVPFAQPRPGERPGSSIGTNAAIDGTDIVDQGRDLAATVWQRESDWRFGLSLRFDRVAPLIRFDVRVQYVGIDSEVLDWVRWEASGWSFVEGIFDGLESELGYGAMKELSTGGSLLYWRSRESYGDGDFAQWGPVQESAIAQVMGAGDLSDEPAVPGSDTVSLVLFMGGPLSSGTEFVGGNFLMGWSENTDASAANTIHDQLARSGTWGMPGIPDWARNCHILETTIGSWPQNERGDAFAPYPTTEDLIADLDRVTGLGFDLIYLMPRHPFPGYTTASLESLAVQYGDGEGTDDRFAKLVDAIHSHGMHVICDVILHGVLDQEALDQQEARRTATAHPIPELGTTPASGPRTSRYDWDTYERAHEVQWREVAPAVHRYWIEHPEWFTQLPDGRAQFTYTRAFDLRHPGLQEFIVETLVGHIERSGIDGYRFDAPWWNQRCYRWQDDRTYRSSWTTGAGRELISRIYDRAESRGLTAVSFVESCDSTSAGSAHLQYPYDEMPVFAALMGGSNTASEARQRLAYLRGVHAPGVTVAHWIDSHDSLAWAPVGRKWKREVYGIDAVRAGSFLATMRDGAFMMFSGGEEGQEDWLQKLMALRRALPILQNGHCDELAVTTDDADILPILRSHDGDWLIAVNSWASEERVVRLRLPDRLSTPENLSTDLIDELDSGRKIAWESGRIVLRLRPHESALIAPTKSQGR